MNIAYTIAPEQGGTDLLLSGVAKSLTDKGMTPVGTVQINTDCAYGGPCDMDVKVLPDGPTIRISQSLGRGAKGCRLNAAALEEAVGHVEQRLDAGADFLIINKFGKREAEGGGFRNVIGKAMLLDVPVFVGTNNLNRDALVEFAGGMAVAVDPDHSAILDWLGRANQPVAKAV